MVPFGDAAHFALVHYASAGPGSRHRIGSVAGKGQGCLVTATANLYYMQIGAKVC